MKSFLKYYLEYSMRGGAYATNLFFGAIIVAYVGQAFAGSPLESVLIWTYGILLYEGIGQSVRYWHKPVFKKKSEVVAQGLHRVPGLLVLDDEEYEYRLRLERLIRQLALYYVIQFLISFLILTLGGVNGQVDSYFDGAIMGIILQVHSFFGVMLFIAMENSAHRALRRSLVLPILVTLAFVVPLLLYILYALFFFYS